MKASALPKKDNADSDEAGKASDPRQLIVDHLDLWTGAITRKSTSGRGFRNKLELTGIKKLRDLILELAVRGKLVPQDQKDEPASVLIQRIEKTKVQLVSEKKLKKQKPLPGVDDIEIDYPLPSNWVWTRLGTIAEISPRNIVDDDVKASFVPMAMISTSHTGAHEQEVKIWSEVKSGFTHFANGDIAIAKITPCFENSKAAVFQDLQNGIGAGTTELHVARPFGASIQPRYILLCLKSPTFLAVGETKMTGSAGQKRVPKAYFSENPIPLPPLPEQHRIVAKVDELMALCDQLETQTYDSISAHETLVETLLGTLTQSADNTELAENWARLAEHFDTLFTTEHSVEQLKQTILQLAVMGKLVSQDPNDEPASDLIRQIADAKGKTRKIKEHLRGAESEFPFTVPKGWECVRFSQFAQEIATGPFGSIINKREYVSGGTPLINPSHMCEGSIIEDIDISVSPEKAAILSAYRIHEGDIVVARRGELGRCALVTSREHGWLCGTGSFVLRFHPSVQRSYVMLLFSSRYVREYLGGESVGTTMTNLNHNILNKMPVGIPPIYEQKRIVAKVAELTDAIRSLTDRLNKAAQTRGQLTEAIVESVMT